MKILIINPHQFGYTAGYFYYCKYLLKNNHSIDYICLDSKMPIIEHEGINVIYVKNKLKINWRFSYFNYLLNIDYSIYDIIFLNHQKFSFLYRAVGLPSKSILDIRTGDLSENRLSRFISNRLIKFDTIFFKNITILSESLMNKLKIRSNKCTILPLGAETMSFSNKISDDLKLLYIGTLHKRNIGQTIEGVNIFSKKNKNIRISYDIIGYGSNNDILEITDSIKNKNLESIITFHGRKNFSELESFFNKCNIGLSYIPITPYFDCQPPTKTYEYILSGLFCIATKTIENKKLINKENGILIYDNPQSLSDGLEEYLKIKDNLNSNTIRNTLQMNLWSNIVNKVLEPLFYKIIRDKVSKV